MLHYLTLVLSTLLATWQTYWIPAGSMKPTLLIGDYVLARPTRSMPDRGDVVMFLHPIQGTVYVKRVIGLPGDRVQMQGGALHLNGNAVPAAPGPDFEEIYGRQGPGRARPVCANAAVRDGETCLKRRSVETLPNGPSYAVLDIRGDPLDDTAAVTVPEGHFFVLGDNRDNSLDSRVSQSSGGVGMVPLENLLARADIVFFSSAGRKIWNPANWREGRYFEVIR